MSMVCSIRVLLLSFGMVKKRFSTVCEPVDNQHLCYWNSGFLFTSHAVMRKWTVQFC